MPNRLLVPARRPRARRVHVVSVSPAEYGGSKTLGAQYTLCEKFLRGLELVTSINKANVCPTCAAMMNVALSEAPALRQEDSP